MTDALATAAIVAAGSALTIVAQLYRESRNRQWEAEDRRENLAQAKAHAAELADHLAQKVENTAADLERTVAATAARTESAAVSRSGMVLDRIAENTEISIKAFDTANNVNAKIASIGLEMKDGRRLSPGENGKKTNS